MPVRPHLPDFDLGLFFIGADEDGRIGRHAHLLHLRLQIVGKRLVRAFAEIAGNIAAAGKQSGEKKRNPKAESPGEPGSDGTKSPAKRPDGKRIDIANYPRSCDSGSSAPLWPPLGPVIRVILIQLLLQPSPFRRYGQQSVVLKGLAASLRVFFEAFFAPQHGSPIEPPPGPDRRWGRGRQTVGQEPARKADPGRTKADHILATDVALRLRHR